MESSSYDSPGALKGSEIGTGTPLPSSCAVPVHIPSCSGAPCQAPGHVPLPWVGHAVCALCQGWSLTPPASALLWCSPWPRLSKMPSVLLPPQVPSPGFLQPCLSHQLYPPSVWLENILYLIGAPKGSVPPGPALEGCGDPGTAKPDPASPQSSLEIEQGSKASIAVEGGEGQVEP